MIRPLVYVLWGTSAGTFAVVAGAMLAWKWLSETIDEALMWE